jgi:hypothetical protein
MNAKKLLNLLILALLLAGILPAAVAADPPQLGNVEQEPPEPGAEPVLSATGQPASVPAALNPNAVLWDQYANWSGTDFAAQDLGAGYEAYEIYAGDDFANIDHWTIETIITRGGWGYFVDLSGASAIHWYIYPDVGGEPGGVPGDGSEFWSISLPPGDPQVGLGVSELEDVVLTLDTPVSLPPGTWWLVYYVSLEFASYGQYGWSGTIDPPWGAVGMQNNPGGGFGMPPGWNANTYGQDFMFRLEGTEGGGGNCDTILLEDFESWPPPGWTVVNNGGDCVWESTATTGRTNYAGGDGNAADADSDWCGSGTFMDTELRTPLLDLSGYTTATLQFVSSYNDIGGGDYAEVNASDDGGGSWTTLLTWDEDHDANGPGELVTLNLDDYAGSANSQVSFHYGDATYDWWYEVDQVVVNACVTELRLTPEVLETSGCSDVLQTHTFELTNLTGVDDTFDLSYNATPNGTLTGPDQIYLGNGVSQELLVELTPDACLFAGDEVLASIDASAQATTFTVQALITKTVNAGLDEWYSTADTPQGTRYHAVAEYGGDIFQIGGETGWWTPTAVVNEYDIATDTWGPAAPLPLAINTMDAVTIGNLIYVPGGSDDIEDWRDGGTFLNTLHIYDPVADSWSTGAPMPVALAGASAVTDGSLLYVIGGLTDAGVAADTLHIYDPGTSSWSTGASMAGARSLASAAYVNGKIYVAGGYLGANGGDTSVNTTEVYDIAGDAWNAGPALPQASAPYGDAMYDGRYFFIFNGGDLSIGAGFYCSQDAIWWDTVYGTLDHLAPLPRCLYGSQGVAVGNRIYSISGRTNEGGWHMAVENQYLEDCPACPEIGWLDGYVTDAETGSVDPACTDAFVHLTPGDYTAPVDPATGYYSMEVYSHTYTAGATAPGYSLETAMVDVLTGMTTTQDFSLQRPVISVEPSDFISVQVLIDTPTTFPMVIGNEGSLPLDFEIYEFPSGAVTLGQAEPLAFLTTWLEGEVEVDPQVLAELDAAGATDFFVRMRLQADLSPAEAIEDWDARGQYVYDSLVAAAKAQQPTIQYAQQRGLEYESRLVINAVFVKGGTLADVNALATLGDVKRISANRLRHLDAETQAAGIEAFGWNLGNLDPDAGDYGMEAAQVWQDFGVRGDGIVVANIDTGAYYEHEALVRQYRGNNGDGTFTHDYNWYNPTVTGTISCGGDDTTPCDWNGHGSGTAGIMVGETADLVEQNGVAPGAQWISCMGCDTQPNGCSDEALTSCADWMVAPCPIGADPGDPACDPSKRPHVINNSWGDVGCDSWYDSYVAAWRAAGQFPAFSAGNDPACGAVGSPGDTPMAFGTAAHASDGVNLYAGGPSCYFPDPSCAPSAHEVDPHLNAPTFGRTPANYPGGYFDLSGTSGASPHTAGCVALMWAANPNLIGNIGATFTLLEQTADRSSTQPWAEGTCGKPTCAGSNTYPNFEYGWGYLDCYAAVDEVLATALPWVEATPVAGIVPPQDDAIVDVTFTCTQTQDYAGTLRILNNDPCMNPYDVPIEIHCVECVEVEMVDLSLVTADPIYVGDTVAFSADIVPDYADKPYNYSIDYGDGSAPVTGTSSDDPLLILNHTFLTANTFTVEISVWNCDMTPAEAKVDTVYVRVLPPPFQYIYLPIVIRD